MTQKLNVSKSQHELTQPESIDGREQTYQLFADKLLKRLEKEIISYEMQAALFRSIMLHKQESSVLSHDNEQQTKNISTFDDPNLKYIKNEKQNNEPAIKKLT